MRLHRFFVHDIIEKPLESIRDGEVIITDDALLHQWRNVFRFSTGNDVVLLDNTGNEYLSNISELTKNSARLHIAVTKKVINVPKRNITLFASLIKGDHFEWVLQKGTELGVTSFVPIQALRSEKKALNIERSRKIIREAAEQSGRGMLPELYGIHALEEAIGEFETRFIIFDREGETFIPSQFELNIELGLLIGPEGGWSEHEIELVKNKNIPIYSLGPQVLRAETAAIATASLLLL